MTHPRPQLLRIRRLLTPCLGACLGVALSVSLLPAMGHAGGESAATQQAQSLIAQPYRTQVLFLQGSGTPQAINRWTYFFYDPSAENNLREVQIVDGKVALFKPADLHRAVRSDLVFDPGLNKVGVESALKTANDYAAQNQISYDHVRVLLRRPSAGVAPQWRVELLQDESSHGVVYTGPDGGLDHYAAAGTSGGSDSAAGFFNDVKNTFLGIGGDLQEFFTGERTVDQ